MATISAGHPHRPNKLIFAAALSAILALAAGIGVWQLTRRDVPISGTRVTRTAPMPAAAVPARVNTLGRDQLTVYLVANDEGATLLRSSMERTIDPSMTEAVAQSAVEIIVVESREDELNLALGLDVLDKLRLSLGLPPVLRIDLRSSRVVEPSVREDPVSDQEMYQRVRPASEAHEGHGARQP